MLPARAGMAPPLRSRRILDRYAPRASGDGPRSATCRYPYACMLPARAGMAHHHRPTGSSARKCSPRERGWPVLRRDNRYEPADAPRASGDGPWPGWGACVTRSRSLRGRGWPLCRETKSIVERTLPA